MINDNHVLLVPGDEVTQIFGLNNRHISHFRLKVFFKLMYS